MSYRSVTHRPDKPQEVKILGAGNVRSLENQINELLMDGDWRPLGEIIVVDASLYLQKMARYDSSGGSAGPM